MEDGNLKLTNRDVNCNYESYIMFAQSTVGIPNIFLPHWKLNIHETYHRPSWKTYPKLSILYFTFDAFTWCRFQPMRECFPSGLMVCVTCSVNICNKRCTQSVKLGQTSVTWMTIILLCQLNSNRYILVYSRHRPVSVAGVSFSTWFNITQELHTSCVPMWNKHLENSITLW